MRDYDFFQSNGRMLHNMSVPPKSVMRKRIVPLFEYEDEHRDASGGQRGGCIIFDPIVLSGKLGSERSALARKSSDFYLSHLQEFERTPKPRGYMISVAYGSSDDDSGFEAACGDSTGNGIRCDDVFLLILVFSKTVNGLYIPRRQPDFSSDNFARTLFFSKLEVADTYCEA